MHTWSIFDQFCVLESPQQRNDTSGSGCNYRSNCPHTSRLHQPAVKTSNGGLLKTHPLPRPQLIASTLPCCTVSHGVRTRVDSSLMLDFHMEPPTRGGVDLLEESERRQDRFKQMDAPPPSVSYHPFSPVRALFRSYLAALGHPSQHPNPCVPHMY